MEFDDLVLLVRDLHKVFCVADITYNDYALFFEYFHHYLAAKDVTGIKGSLSTVLIWLVGVMHNDSMAPLSQGCYLSPDLVSLQYEILFEHEFVWNFRSQYELIYVELGLEGDVGDEKIMQCFIENNFVELRRLLELKKEEQTCQKGQK